MRVLKEPLNHAGRLYMPGESVRGLPTEVILSLEEAGHLTDSVDDSEEIPDEEPKGDSPEDDEDPEADASGSENEPKPPSQRRGSGR
ncbi:hypothetical protein [Paenibacillus sp. 2TAB19]|uniref:hypothetical protein n=1 Tax=Paenibacillus sp. 2TAB19 TaxID=3233003 RepID=UPI003F9E32E7